VNTDSNFNFVFISPFQNSFIFAQQRSQVQVRDEPAQRQKHRFNQFRDEPAQQQKHQFKRLLLKSNEIALNIRLPKTLYQLIFSGNFELTTHDKCFKWPLML
jgi:hypothetical protein